MCVAYETKTQINAIDKMFSNPFRYVIVYVILSHICFQTDLKCEFPDFREVSVKQPKQKKITKLK
jgi:hypothetical protein